MAKAFRNLLLLMSIFVLIGSAVYSIPYILQTQKINKEIAEQSTPSDLNPLQVLPKGVRPTPNISPVSVNNSEFPINKLEGDLLNYCKTYQNSIASDSTGLINLMTNSLNDYTSITLGANDYYLRQSTASGKTINNFDNLLADSLSKQRILASLINNMKGDVKGFDCNGSNPSSQIGLFTNDSTQALSLLKDYNLSVKNILLALKSSSIEPVSTSSSGLKNK